MVYVETITSDRSCFQVIVGPYFVGLHWSASVGVGVVVDEDGLSGAGGHVVVVVAGDGEVVDGFGSSGGLDRHHLGDLAVGGVEGVALVEVRGRCVAAALDVERVGGRGLDGAAGGGHPQGGDLLMNKGLFHGGGFVLAGGGVVGEDLLAGLDLADGFGGAVGHEDGGVGCEAAVAGDAGDVGQGPAGAAAEGSLACALADGLGEPEMLISSDLKDRSVLSSENSTFVASLSTDNEVMSVEVSKGQSLSVFVGTVAQDFVCSLTFSSALVLSSSVGVASTVWVPTDSASALAPSPEGISVKDVSLAVRYLLTESGAATG